MNAKRITHETTMDDLLANPEAYGVPSLESYKRQREKFLGREDEAMIVLTDGPKMFRRDLRKMHYKVHGMEMTEEQVEIALGDYGFKLADIDLENQNSRLPKKINIIPQGGGKYDIEVDFLP